MNSSKTALADYLEIWGFENDFVLFSDGSLGFGLRLTPLDITSWDDNRIDELARRSATFLNGLPVGIDFQFVREIKGGNDSTIALNASLQENGTSETVKELHKERLDRLRLLDSAGNLPKHSLSLFVRRPQAHHFFEKPKLFSKKRHFEDIAQGALALELEEILRLQEDLKKGLKSLGISSKVILEKEMSEIVYSQWNPSRNIKLAEYDPEDLRSSLLFTDLAIHKSGFSLGDIEFRVISLKLMPDHTFSSMAQILEGLPFDSKLFLSVHVPEQQKELENLQLQRRIAFSMARGKKTGVSDIESETKFQDLETLISQMVAQGEKVFHFSLNILIRGKDDHEINERVSETLALIREMNSAEAMEETVAAFDIFSEFAIPNARAKERKKLIKTSNLCDLLPLYGSWEGHEIPRILLKSKQGSLVSFDPFASEHSNYNQIVTGGSGSGKSFLTNLLMLQMLKESPKMFIVDIGGSYKKLCDNLDGQYIPFSLDASISINPFDLKEGETEPSSEKIKFLSGLIEMMAKEDSEKRLGKLEQAEIEEAIFKVYQRANPSISSLREILIQHPDLKIQKYGKILSTWCGNSPFGRILDRKTTVSLSRNIVCFDLKGLESVPDLQAVCLYAITGFVWKEIQRDRSTMKFLVFDECWKLLENDAGSSFIAEVFRTFRKYFASAIAISQNIDDFAKSKVAAAILPNTSIKWILMQKGADPARLKEVLQLNDTEMAQIASLHQSRGSYSEAFLMAENQHVVVAIEPTPLEYWVATSDSRDLAAFEDEKSAHPDCSQLQVLRQLAKKCPQGVAAHE